ncbi:MAG: hypothetical protein ACI80S_001245, partial [Pseudohongiellaceae bacterium]
MAIVVTPEFRVDNIQNTIAKPTPMSVADQYGNNSKTAGAAQSRNVKRPNICCPAKNAATLRV